MIDDKPWPAVPARIASPRHHRVVLKPGLLPR